MQEVVIIPTGDEIRRGLVVDTNSPKIMELIIAKWPDCKVVRTTPPEDNKEMIQKEIKYWGKGAGIIFLTGGAGGGKVFNSGLSVDCTHIAAIELMQDSESTEIYGSNGHLLAKIVAGKFEDKLIITLPGPTVEAVNGAKAALEALTGRDNISYREIVTKVAQAICEQYPSKNLVKIL